MMIKPNGDRDVRRSTLKAIDQPSGARNEVANADSNRHCQENPECQEAIKERELLPLQRRTNVALGIRCSWTLLFGLKSAWAVDWNWQGRPLES